MVLHLLWLLNIVTCLPSSVRDRRDDTHHVRRDDTHHVRNPFRNFSPLPLMALSKSPLNMPFRWTSKCLFPVMDAERK